MRQHRLLCVFVIFVALSFGWQAMAQDGTPPADPPTGDPAITTQEAPSPIVTDEAPLPAATEEPDVIVTQEPEIVPTAEATLTPPDDVIIIPTDDVSETPATPDPLTSVFSTNFETPAPELIIGAGWTSITLDDGLALQSGTGDTNIVYRTVYGDAALRIGVLFGTGALRLNLRKTETETSLSRYSAVLTHDGTLSLYRDETLLASTPVALVEGQWVTLELRAIGGEIRASANEVSLSYSDLFPLSGGTIGLSTEDESILRIDDLVILAQGEGTPIETTVTPEPAISTPAPTATPQIAVYTGPEPEAPSAPLPMATPVGVGPAIASPANGSAINDSTPVWNWPQTAGATYTLQIARNNTFTVGLQTFLNITNADLPYSLPVLPQDGLYYARVQRHLSPTNFTNFGPIVSFTLDTVAPTTTITPLVPANVSRVTTVRPLFTWPLVAGIARYQIQVDDDGAFDGGIGDAYNSPLIAATPTTLVKTASFTIQATGPGAGILPQGTLYYRVVPQDIAGNISTGTAPVVQFEALLGTQPAANGVVNTTKPVFTWASVVGATGYKLQVSETSDFSTFVLNESVTPSALATTSFTPATDIAAAPGGTRYWRVLVDAGSSTGGLFNRVTVSLTPAPLAPLVTGPAALINDTTPTITWNSVANAATYEIQVDETSNFSTTPAFEGTTNGALTIDVASALTAGTYYIRVRGHNAAGVPGPFGLRTFVLDTTAPSAPTLNPLMNGVVTTAPRPTFSWTALPLAEGIAHYQLDVSNNNFASNMSGYNGLTVAGATYTAPAATQPLSPGLYQWRVRGMDKAGNPGAYSIGVFFVSPFAATGPVVNTIEGVATAPLTNDTRPELTFTPSSLTIAGFTRTHEVQFSTVTTFPAASTITIKGLTSADTTLNDAEWGAALLPNAAKQVYHVQMRTVYTNANDIIVSPYGAKRTFTLDTTAPGIPAITAPINGFISVTPTPRFTWVARPLAESVGGYRLDVSNNNFTSTLPEYTDRIVAGATSVSFVVPAPGLPNGLYQWRLRALDTAGNPSANSVTGVFVVNATALTAPTITTVEGAATGALSKDNQPEVVFTTTNAALVGLTRTHEVQFSTANTFLTANTIIVKGITDESLDDADWVANTVTSLPNTAGQIYHVRVQTIFTDGTSRIVSPFSATKTFTLDTTAPGMPVLTGPINGAVVLTPRPTFSWTLRPATEGATSYRLDVSNDGFSSTLASYTDRIVTGASFPVPTTDQPFADGLYQWRLRAMDNAGNPSPSATGSFLLNSGGTVLTAPTIATLEGIAGAPVTNDVTPDATFTTTNPLVLIGLNRTHEVQFSTVATFLPANTITVKGGSTSLEDAHWLANAISSLPMTPSQIYYVRAQTVYTDGINRLASPFSAPARTMTLDTTPLGTPVVTVPAAGAIVKSVRPTITWTKIAGAAKYRIYDYPAGYPGTPVEISVFTGVVPATATTVSYIIPAGSPALVQGPHTISVLAEDAAGNLSADVPANHKSFTVFIGTEPAPGAVIIPTPANPAITFKWEPVAGATSYKLQISTLLDDFTGALEPVLASPTSTSATVTLAPDTYQWRVLVNGAPLPGSVNRTLNVVSATLNAATLNLAVEGDDVISTADDSNGITFTWTAPAAVPAVAVDGYFVQTSNLNTFPAATTITSPFIGVTTYIAPANLLPETTKFWRVVTRYGSDEGTLVNSTPRPITIDRTAPLATAIALPAASAIVTTVRPTITWTALPLAQGVAGYQVDIATDSNFTSFVSGFESLPVPTTSLIPAVNLPQTTLFARVRAVDKAGNVGPNSATRSFGLFIATAPANNLISNDTTPTFIWTAQTGASGYTIQLDTNGNFNSVEYSFPATASPFTVPVGQELPFGAYVWRVIPNGETRTPGLTRTLIIANPLTAPALISPANGAFTPDNRP